MSEKIPANSTVASIWTRLTNQRDYVAGVRHKAERCRKVHGNAYVKIGVTGSGQKPCYRVSYMTADGAEKIFGSYWDMHEPLDNERAVNTNWSTAAMTFQEIHTLMLEKHPPNKKL